MRVLGIDPGLTRCGIAVLDGVVGGSIRVHDISVITTTPQAAHEQRLMDVSDGIEACIARFGPEAIAIERVFSQHNVRSVMGTAQVAGLAMVLAAHRGIDVAMYTPTEVKAAITGSGRADKAQVGFMVQRVLSRPEPITPADAADAAAIAICHIWRGAARKRLTDAMASHP
jgi:crossover junction endodeoxyribonuclease RuvC